MKLLKIDPNTRTVEAVESSGKLADLCQLLDCRLIDACARQDNGDALIIDDEGLYRHPQPAAFSYRGVRHIHGVALLTGCDEEGETTEPKTSIEEAIRHIEWQGNYRSLPRIHVMVFPS
ncbi:DUF3846 domain-containing protein [Spirosoma luteum]|uniref:DUF3846 domain-containing protein n=1 Tax=Spirosoma luteum TaxID=431553 RepID=UPI00035F57A4|nr:hypothetical protein [Spirosoma luteum]